MDIQSLSWFVIANLGCLTASMQHPTVEVLITEEPTTPTAAHITEELPAQTTTPPPPPPVEKAAPPHDFLTFYTECAAPVPSSEVRKTILDRVFEGTDPYDGFPSATTAAMLLRPADQPHGWGSKNPVFADMVEAVKQRTIIEVGTFLGGSVLHMAALTRNLSTTILCVDDFPGWPGFRAKDVYKHVPRNRQGDALLMQQFMLGVQHAAETERVVPMPFATASELASLCQWGVYGDLIEVDAGHDFHSAWMDINMAWAVLRPGGVLFGHDYYNGSDNYGVQRAVNLFAKLKALAVAPNGEHWVLSPKPQRNPADGQ